MLFCLGAGTKKRKRRLEYPKKLCIIFFCRDSPIHISEPVWAHRDHRDVTYTMSIIHLMLIRKPNGVSLRLLNHFLNSVLYSVACSKMNVRVCDEQRSPGNQVCLESKW